MTLVLIPHDATPTKYRVASVPLRSTYETRPASMRAVRPVRRIFAASRVREGISSVLLKSPPVPLGRIPSSASFPDDKMPFATSEIVPSPPHAMMNFAPLRAASFASAAASPRCLVNRTRNAPNCERRSLAICGHASPVLPPADDGLTITTDIDLFRTLQSSHCFVFFAELSNFCHDRVGNLFVRSQSIGFREVLAQIQ